MHEWRNVACQWRHAWNEANGWKLITARLTVHLNGGPLLAAKTGPSGPILAAKLVRGSQVWQNFAKISLGGPFLGGSILV